MRLYCCKPILQIFYKDTNAPIRNQATHRHVIACVCIFVNPSCKYFTKNQTHQSETKQRIVMSSRAFVLSMRIYFKYRCVKWAFSMSKCVKEMCKLTRIYVLAYAKATSLSRGAWNRAIFGRHTGNASSCHRVRLYCCKPILQINAPIRNQATHRHVIACVCMVVNPSC